MPQFELTLSKLQFNVIFKMADYFNKYKQFFDKFNNTDKYKMFRPVFPVGYEPSKQLSFRQRTLAQLSQNMQKPLGKQEEVKLETLELCDEEEEDDVFYDALDEFLP